MMEDIAELGASSAKDYIRGLEKDIHRLNDTKENMEYENKTLEEKINEQENELSKKVAEMSMYQVKLDKLNEELENRGEMYNKAIHDNHILQNEIMN